MDSAVSSSRRRSDSHGGTKSRSKKRKQRSADVVEEVREISKSARIDCGGEEEHSPWKNLQLVLSLQDKNVDIMK